LENNNQNTIRHLQKQIDQEIGNRHKAEERVRMLTVELATEQHRQALNEAATEERIRFDVSLSEIFAYFINLPPDQVDGKIEDAQRRVCECLGIDMSTLWQWEPENPDELLLTHLYRSLDDSPAPPRRMVASEKFPWSFQQVMAGKMFAISSMENVPAEAVCQVESWRYFGIKATVCIPLIAGGGLPCGAVTFQDMRAERNWSDTLLNRLQLVAQVFSNALARKRSDEALRESERRLNLATEAAEAGLWSMDPGTKKVWVSTKIRELFHFTPDADLNYESFIEKIHPDDRDRVKEAVQQALLSGENMQSDYRIMLSDGNIRWISARGQRYLNETGKTSRLMGVSLDITERMRAEHALRARLQFETLLIGISTRFINQSADGIDREIEDALLRVCDLLGIDLAAVWQWLPDSAPGCVTLTHFYRTDEGPRLEEQMTAQEHFPWYQQQVIAGRIVNLSSIEELPAEAARDLELGRNLGIKSNLTIPLSVGGLSPIGAFGLNSTREERNWSEEIVGQLQLVAQVFANALERKRMEDQLLGRLQDIKVLSERLENENLYLQKEINFLGDHGKIVGKSLVMKRIMAAAGQVAATDSTVLILGETGTGKEMLARFIHQKSARKDRPLVTINCASLPPTLIESELFGREKGAYTGAITKMIGRFEIADRSTLFLDEIAELPIELQVKLLRVLEEGVFERLGSSKPVHVNVRILAATNRDIENEVEKGRFRKDLFYRLNIFPIVIPPLRERSEDIPQMVWTFVEEFKKRMGKEIETISKKSMESLRSYSWPGNVRELRNVIEHAMILNNTPHLVVQLPRSVVKEKVNIRRLDDLERKHIASVLEETNWRVSGKGGAAEILGLQRSTLQSKMKKLGISRPNF
jgi:PAS domain S-box-containing protein